MVCELSGLPVTKDLDPVSIPLLMVMGEITTDYVKPFFLYLEYWYGYMLTDNFLLLYSKWLSDPLYDYLSTRLSWTIKKVLTILIINCTILENDSLLHLTS